MVVQKKTTSAKPKRKHTQQVDKNSVRSIGKELEDVFRQIKEKYDSLDDKTKKQIIAGVAALGGLLIGSITTKKNKKKK